MDKKYELLTDQSIEVDGHTLYRIRALRDFGVIGAGEIGGFVEGEANLSHYDACWIGDNARVRGKALVRGNAQVYGNAQVSGNARVHDNAQVYGDAKVYDNAQICDNAQVYGNARVGGSAFVYGSARIGGNALIRQVTDYLTLGPIGSRHDITTFYRAREYHVEVMCGCFSGSLDDFVERVKQVHGGSHHGKAYLLAADLARVQLMR